MEVEALCTICLQFYNGPYAVCTYCGMFEATHHSGCCLEKPANRRRRRTQPQLICGPPIGQYEPPVQSPGNGAPGNEPMVTWPKYGLTVPLEVWEMQQARENSLAYARERFYQTQIAPLNAVQPKPAQTKYSHWQAVATIPKNSGTPANRSVPASTAKARGLAAMNSQMQTFVPGSTAANHQPVQNRTPEDSHNNVIELFDLTNDDTYLPGLSHSR